MVSEADCPAIRAVLVTESVAGVDAGTPCGSEAACDLAKHDGGADFALGDVAGVADPAILDKDEVPGSPGPPAPARCARPDGMGVWPAAGRADSPP